MGIFVCLPPAPKGHLVIIIAGGEWGRDSAPGIYWVKPQMVLNILQYTGQPLPPKRKCLASNANSASLRNSELEEF